MVTKLRNYSTTAEATMTKFKLSSKAIYLGGNPKKMNFLAVQVTEIFDLNGISKRAKFLLFSLHLDWRSRREVLLPLTESIFHGHETTQLLNNCWSYDDEI